MTDQEKLDAYKQALQGLTPQQAALFNFQCLTDILHQLELLVPIVEAIFKSIKPATNEQEHL